MPQAVYFGFEGFVFGFFTGQVVTGERRAVPDACRGQQVGDLGQLVAVAPEVRNFEQAFFYQGGNQVVNLALAGIQLPGKIPLGNFRVLFDGAKNLKMDLFSWSN